MTMKTPALAVDETITLDIAGSHQRVRLCATRPALPPLVVVQHGPGVPVLHEVAKFQRRLQLERHYLVVYWEQRGCGNASGSDAERVSLAQQVDDLGAVIRWVADRTQQKVLLFGVSIGATISLLAAAREGARVKAVVANSPDLNTRAGDAAVDAFLHEQVRRGGSGRARRMLANLRSAAVPFSRSRFNVGPSCWLTSARLSAAKRLSPCSAKPSSRWFVHTASSAR